LDEDGSGGTHHLLGTNTLTDNLRGIYTEIFTGSNQSAYAKRFFSKNLRQGGEGQAHVLKAGG